MFTVKKTLLALLVGLSLFASAPRQAKAAGLDYYAYSLAYDGLVYGVGAYNQSPSPTAYEYYAYIYAYYGYLYTEYAYVNQTYTYQYDAAIFCYYSAIHSNYSYQYEGRSYLWFVSAIFETYASDVAELSYYYSPYGI